MNRGQPFPPADGPDRGPPPSAGGLLLLLPTAIGGPDRPVSGVGCGSPVGGVAVVGDGFVPAVLQRLEEAVFDFGGDVGVGLLDLVAEDVAQPSGLGDFGDAVGDHPGLVAVTQPVERQPGFDRFSRTVGSRPGTRFLRRPGAGRGGRSCCAGALAVGDGEHVRMVVACPGGRAAGG